VAPRSEDPKLIIRVINFELVKSIYPGYINVTDGQTDRQTTYDSNTAQALRTSRGKNKPYQEHLKILKLPTLGIFISPQAELVIWYSVETYKILAGIYDNFGVTKHRTIRTGLQNRYILSTETRLFSSHS